MSGYNQKIFKKGGYEKNNLLIFVFKALERIDFKVLIRNG